MVRLAVIPWANDTPAPPAPPFPEPADPPSPPAITEPPLFDRLAPAPAETPEPPAPAAETPMNELRGLNDGTPPPTPPMINAAPEFTSASSTASVSASPPAPPSPALPSMGAGPPVPPLPPSPPAPPRSAAVLSSFDRGDGQRDGDAADPAVTCIPGLRRVRAAHAVAARPAATAGNVARIQKHAVAQTRAVEGQARTAAAAVIAEGSRLTVVRDDRAAIARQYRPLDQRRYLRQRLSPPRAVIARAPLLFTQY